MCTMSLLSPLQSADPDVTAMETVMRDSVTELLSTHTNAVPLFSFTVTSLETKLISISAKEECASEVKVPTTPQ